MRFIKGDTAKARNQTRRGWIWIIVWLGPVYPAQELFYFSIDQGMELLRIALVFFFMGWSIGGLAAGHWVADKLQYGRGARPFWPFEQE